jgi:hypothetical protein
MPRNLILFPIKGTFDIADIQGYLDAQPDVFIDPHGTGIYVVCGLPDAVPYHQSARQDDPSRFPYAGLVHLGSDIVRVTQEMADEDELRSTMEFVKWMWSRFECRVRDEYGQDFTEQCRRDGIDSLYPDSVANLPIPWAAKLIKVGFFRELEHGDTSGPSLDESRTDTPSPDEDRIARYLDAGHLYSASEGMVEDWLADDSDLMIGAPHILTDGVYAWPADLPYYVRNYHVRLPRHFVMHIQRNEFQVPGNVNVVSLKME